MNKLALLPISLAFAAPAVIAQCTIVPPGALQAPAVVDGWSTSIALGFTLPFQGTTYTHFYYSDHGVITLNNAGVPAAPPGAQQVWDPGSLPNTSGQNGQGFAGFTGDSICAYWGDNVIGALPGAGVYVDNTSGTHCTITWFENEPFGAPSVDAITFQLTLRDTGVITICLDSRCDNTSSTFDPVTTVIGITDGTSTIPAESDFSMGPIVAPGTTVYEEFTGPGPVGTNSPDPNFDLADSTIEFLPTNPGWLVTVAPLACAAKTTYGTGCDGLALDSTLPVLGGNWTLTTTGVSANSPIAITFFGAQSIPAGLPLTVIGINSPGCSAYVDSLLGTLDAPANAGTAVLTVPLPNNATLKGAVLYAQSLGLTVAFPSLLATSNGLQADLGY